MGILKQPLAISLRGNLFNRQLFLPMWNMRVVSILCSLLAVIALTDLVPGAEGNTRGACSVLCGGRPRPTWATSSYLQPGSRPRPPSANYYPRMGGSRPYLRSSRLASTGSLNLNGRSAFPPPDGETWPDYNPSDRNTNLPEENTEFWGNGWNPSIQDKNTRQHFDFAKTHDCTMRVGPRRYCAPRPSAISSAEVAELLDKGIISIPGAWNRRPLPTPWWGVS